MSTIIDRLRGAETVEALDPLVAEVPYASFLGLRVDTIEPELIVRMPYAEHLIGDNNIPALHGGTLGALLESTAIFTVLRATAATSLPKTITLTVDYLRSGRATDTFARARITKPGRTIAIVQVEAWQTERERPIASANVHFLLRPTDEG